MGSLSSNLALSLASVMTVVGAFDAFIGGEWDFLAIFCIIGLLLLVIWLRQRADRVPMSIRPDLARWLQHQSRSSGEPVEDITDRALAAYRTGLVARDTS